MAKDSLGVSYEQRASEMSNEEAATWLERIILDGYRTSIQVAVFKACKMLREAAPDGK